MGTASALVAALGGAVVAVVGAAALSPLFPLGVARRADPDVGAHVDWVVVAAGFAATVVAVAVIAVAAAVRATRPGRDRSTAYRTSTIAARAAAAGASPPLSHGLRLALERGRGRTAVPVRSAAIGAVLGVLGVTAVLVFGASLDALVAAPARYGAPWDFQVTDETSNTPCGAGDYGLGRQAGIAALTEVCAQSVELDGRPVGTFAYTRLTGRPVRPEIVAGRAPRGRGEVRAGRNDARCTARGDRRRRARSRPVGARSTIASSVRRCSRPWARRNRSPTAPRSPVWAMRRCSTRTCSRGTSSGATRPAPNRTRVRQGLDAVPELTAATGPQLPVEIDRLRQIDWLPVALTLLLGALRAARGRPRPGHGGASSSARARAAQDPGLRASPGAGDDRLAGDGVGRDRHRRRCAARPRGGDTGVAGRRGRARDRCEHVVPGGGGRGDGRRRRRAPTAVAWWPTRAAGRVRPAVALRSE